MLKRASVIALLVMHALFASARPAYAHATLLRSEPKAKSTLMDRPPRVWLLFSEEMEPAMAKLTLGKPDGTFVVLAATGDPHDVNAIMALLDPLGPGSYTVTWHVVSADGHPVNGTLSFTIDASVPPVSVPAAAPTAPPVTMHDSVENRAAAEDTWGPAIARAPLVPALLRGAAMLVTMALFGLLFFMSGTQAGAENQPVLSMARTLAILSPVLLLAHAAVWLMNASADHAISMRLAESVMSHGAGRMEAWRIGLAILTLLALVLVRQPKVALLFSTVVLVVSGGSGHAAAIHPEIAIPAKAIHLLAGGAWIGGVLWLIQSIRRDRAVFLVQAHRVSSVALGAVTLVLFTGIIQTRLFVPTLLDVIRSPYGYVDLAKIVLLGVLVVFGLHHRKRGLPMLPDPANSVDGFHRLLRREFAVMVCVVLLGGLLAYLPPPPM